METAADIYNIYFDKELDAVIMEWNGYATSNQFREGTELMLNVLIQNETSKVLADIRDMVLIGMDDQKWLESNFLPRAIKFGFKEIAIVKPRSYFNKVAVETVSYKVDKENLVINFFDSLEEGRRSLMQHK
ncbi:MAG TPA: hypothetical protein VK489_06005 [Ferruginibacter sp.]|nr:hypothetical protein [Ferruginibacter sp.]